MGNSEEIKVSQELLRKLMFVPCNSKEDLHNWIQVYLNLDLPDQIVHDESNSSPMDFVWEVYSKALANDDDDFQRIMAYASRASYKTLAVAVLEVLALAHMNRSVGHLAAIESQSQKAKKYVQDFLQKSLLRDFLVGDSKRHIVLTRYLDETTGDNYTEKEWKKLPINIRDRCKNLTHELEILICTIRGANSAHYPFMVIDEIDIADPIAYQEAQMIPSSAEGKKPISVLISTRKTAFGLVQKEIEEAGKSGLHVRHWNVIDSTENCPIEKHISKEATVDLYIDDENLGHIAQNKYDQLDEKQKERYRHKKGYEGCIKCPIFSMCEGKLASKQRPNPKTLRPIPDVISVFKKLSTEAAQAQLMCRMPESAGLIFPRFDRDSHCLSATDMATIIHGDSSHGVNDKNSLIDFMIKKGLQFYTGIDWGFNHDFAVVSSAIMGEHCFVFDVISMPGLDPEEKVNVCQKIKRWSPIVFGDPEAPDNISMFRKHGFIMRTWQKGRGSVREGIEFIRTKLWNKETGTPNLFLLKDDLSVERLAEDISKYHFKLDGAGSPTDVPDDKNDDRIDAFRYNIMNAFKNTKVISIMDPVKNTGEITFDRPTTQNFVQYFIDQALGNTDDDDNKPDGPLRGNSPIGVSWDME